MRAWSGLGGVMRVSSPPQTDKAFSLHPALHSCGGCGGSRDRGMGSQWRIGGDIGGECVCMCVGGRMLD